MIDLQTLLTYLTLISVPVGVFYHIMTLRNTRKNQQMQLETRQVQIYMQILDRFTSEENWLRILTVNQMEWDDFDDYLSKWSMDVNPEAAAKKFHVKTELNGLGHLLSRGLIELDFIPHIALSVAVQFWEKYGPIEVELRRLVNLPKRSEYVEYLYNEVVKYREEHPELKT